MKRFRLLRRISVAMALAILVLLFVLFLIPENKPKPTAPLPFDTNGLISTTTYEIFPTKLPPNPSIGDSLRFAYIKLMLKIWPDKPNPLHSNFPGGSTNRCVIQGLLNQCNQTSGTRYLMPLGVAAGSVTFGTSNTLNGVDWIKAFEHALQTGSPEVFDALPGRPHTENLVLIRYPEQKTILVLTKTSASEFRRTNSTGVIDSP